MQSRISPLFSMQYFYRKKKQKELLSHFFPNSGIHCIRCTEAIILRTKTWIPLHFLRLEMKGERSAPQKKRQIFFFLFSSPVLRDEAIRMLTANLFRVRANFEKELCVQLETQITFLIPASCEVKADSKRILRAKRLGILIKTTAQQTTV